MYIVIVEIERLMRGGGNRAWWVKGEDYGIG